MPGRIASEDVEQIRDRVDLVEVIGGHTQLRKAGRIFKGLCPFHQEKTPSFTVDPDKGLYFCFGCGAGGDVFTFTQQVEGLSFGEAAERLAASAGVQIRYAGSKDDGGSRSALVAANEAAAEFFHQTLLSTPKSDNARKYLEARGFSSDDAREWQLGFAPGGKDVLYRHLLSRNFKSSQIVEAGLGVVGEGGEHRDRFRSRLVFPVRDISGQVVGFGARALADETPKYLNSPETPVYRKARILYGMDRARKEMINSGSAVVTEGYTDVIALSKVGVRNAVATCGTALSEEHLALTKRFCDRIILAFDADAAGSLASERAFGIHSGMGLEVLVAPLPHGKDPADVALSEGGEAVAKLFEEAVPLMRFVLQAEISRQRLDTPEGKAKAVRAAADILSWEPRQIARGEHAFWVARRLGVEESAVQTEIGEVKAGARGGKAPERPVRQPGHVKVEREALSILMESPSLIESSGLSSDHFLQPEYRILFESLKELAASADAWELKRLMDKLPDDGARRLAAELALAPAMSPETNEVFARLEEFRLTRQIGQIRSTLDGVDPTQDPGEYDALFEELMRLESLRRKFGEGR